jgi:hypothetical protein
VLVVDVTGMNQPVLANRSSPSELSEESSRELNFPLLVIEDGDLSIPTGKIEEVE